MEGTPKQESSVVEGNESVENLSEWRELKEQAPAQAEAMMTDIEGYDDMSLPEQIEALNILRSDLLESNDNRYIEGVLAHRVKFLEATDKYETELSQLGIAA